jgi:biopolymer transport protein ExbD
MKLRSLRIESQPELMIIPMIDIIFFLLVFFMFSTLSMVQQHTIPLSLPQASTTQQEIPRSITVTVMQDGHLMLDQEEIPLALLGKRVGMELMQQPDSVFILRADKQVEYGKVVTILDELKLAGARRVSVATEQKGR